ncbi:hypothetical protein [Micromonospora sp. RTP1Z1]|uniref:hypothetical protein n=1 Tax=Micromonospora sp. RTP1Z1 TaxID=2994043 RepID=UPI0029C8017D|nr:hypothetical protein [Micromonospora sp. RTP1Z1]
MAFRTWGRLLLTALGVSALAGAGQLGIAYGFGIVRLNGAFTDGSVNRWPAQLVWVAWFAAVAAVAGAVGTERLARRDGVPGGTTEQFSVAGAAALGAIVVAPLCMQPARAAEFGGTVDPVWAVGICAILGAVVGAGAALAVLLNPPLGWNIAMTGGLLWLLALVSVAPALASTGPLSTARLGVLEPSWLDTATAQRLAMLLLPTVALLAGAAVGALARRRGHPPLVGGAAGAAGPVLVAFAYLTAGPGDAADRYQLAPYYGALIAVAAGALGSTAATVLRRPSEVPATDAIEPTDILQPLPTGPASASTGSSVDRTEEALATVGTGGPTTADLDSLPAARGTDPAGADRPTPAHWDWPVASSGTPTPAPAGSARPTISPDTRFGDDRGPAIPAPMPTDDRDVATPAPASPVDDPIRFVGSPAPGAVAADRTIGSPAAGGAGPVIERDADDPAQSLPAPTPLSSARRISAVDVVAAGRTPAPKATRPGTTPAGTASPAHSTDTAAPTPAEAAAPTSARTAAPRRSAGRATPPTDVKGPAPTPDVTAPAATSRGAAAGIEAPAGTPEADVAGPGAEASGGAAGTGLPASPAGSGSASPASAPGRPKRARKSRSVAADASTAAVTTDLPGSPSHSTPTATSATRLSPAPAAGQSRTADRSGTADQATTVDRSGTADPASAADEATAADRAGTAARSGVAPGSTTDTDRPGGRGLASPPADPPSAAAPPGTPAEAGHGFSPRPRLPIFEDDADRRGDVRPAWPAPPRQAAAPTGSTGDATTAGAESDAPVEPAPRPRHRALPDLGRAARWDALANARRGAGPNAVESTPADSPAPVDERARHDDDPAPETDDPAPAATGGGEEADAGKPRPRRGLFRRNRAKGGEESTAERNSREPEPVPAHDEEYVDWVAGLGRPGAESDSGSLRTGRHHRD